MKILVADDSKAMRSIVIRTLRQAGYSGHKVIEAENGAQALELAKDEEPDLIVSDWNMPEMNGLEFLKALRAAGMDTPFGFVTTEASPEMRALADENGAAFLITKPFTAEDFQKHFDEYL
ncbi:response regulator [Plasticicumulans sp.]|uniref:response regulator n=1 Tax=Plasticicumulans sp. TaxID=2307179 RepID=UPI000F9DA1D5|nr:response regulator [Plasticicumulans sp.]MBS0603245.1 response regulator [Pseudomonadota bacterium]RTL06004.1 MAG: response regulator [Xanthomonadales bacterium]HMV38388.1 response regulator [Plasticicumulans sp.]HMW29061.1 response regulator [Plasticicumulans sp.]HMW40986.1 response regulator [Plasticicumulans sp.]